MRALSLLAAVFVVGCAQQGLSRPPPTDRFYFPSGIAFTKPVGSTNGVLYVASANFDKRYDNGTLLAVDLDKVGGTGLPPLGQPVAATGPVSLEALNIPDGGSALLSSFAGEMAAYPLPSGALRLFIPSRSEGDKLQIVDATGTQLACAYPSSGGVPLDCITHALTTSANGATPGSIGKPSAPEPFGVGLSNDGQLFVTSLRPADSPSGSLQNLEAFTVELNAAAPEITDSSFISLGQGASNSVAVGQRYAYLSGRFLPVSNTDTDVVLRLVDRQAKTVIFPQIEPLFHVIEGRGLALSSDEQRLFFLGLSPDTLVRLDLSATTSSSPQVKPVRGIPLPSGPMEVKLIERPGHGELAVISCLSAGSVVIYDEDLGDIAAVIPGVGVQPTNLAIEQEGSQARVFVSDFGDGRVTVIDIPDVLRPQTARVVAYMGKLQTCLVRDTDPSCQGVNP